MTEKVNTKLPIVKIILKPPVNNCLVRRVQKVDNDALNEILPLVKALGFIDSVAQYRWSNFMQEWLRRKEKNLAR